MITSESKRIRVWDLRTAIANAKAAQIEIDLGYTNAPEQKVKSNMI